MANLKIEFLSIYARLKFVTDFIGDKRKKIIWDLVNLKNVFFSNPSILNIFSQKFQGLILGCMGYIDVKGTNVAQSIHALLINSSYSPNSTVSQRSIPEILVKIF